MGCVRDAFGAVNAEDEVKQSTLAAVREAHEHFERGGALASAGRAPARVMTLRRKFALAACPVLALVMAGGWVWLTPTIAISMDVSPSVELGINQSDRVVSACGVNEDGWGLGRGHRGGPGGLRAVLPPARWGGGVHGGQ